VKYAAALSRRLVLLAVVLLAGGLAGASLVRFAPGFGTDERMLDARLNRQSMDALAASHSEGSNIAAYYWRYLGRLCRGDLGVSNSLSRPVSELLRERAAVTARSVGAGLALAWPAALAIALALEGIRRKWCEAAAASLAGALLCVPAAVIVIACFDVGGSPALAVAAILFPRIYRYGRSLLRQSGGAAHVLAAHAFGERRLRVLGWHIVAPAAPELLAVAGASVSMAVGAAVPVEVLSDSPGLGQLMWFAAQARDLPVIVNLTLLIAAVTAIANLAAEAPRIAREARA
jgi:peptide/nickel transport system permease protein